MGRWRVIRLRRKPGETTPPGLEGETVSRSAGALGFDQKRPSRTVRDLKHQKNYPLTRRATSQKRVYLIRERGCSN